MIRPTTTAIIFIVCVSIVPPFNLEYAFEYNNQVYFYMIISLTQECNRITVCKKQEISYERLRYLVGSSYFSLAELGASGGGFGGVIVLIIYLTERFRGQAMNKKWYALLFIVLFILGASFMVWKDKNNQLIVLQSKLKAPQFGGELHDIHAITNDYIKDSVTIIVGGEITNPFGPPSAITNWQMTIKLPDGTYYCGSSFTITI